jgi:hypothetical protein
MAASKIIAEAAIPFCAATTRIAQVPEQPTNGYQSSGAAKAAN